MSKNRRVEVALIYEQPVPPVPQDASPTVKGLVQLAGDLAGTADAPTVEKASGNFVVAGTVTANSFVTSGIVRAGGGAIDLWNDGHIYLAQQTVSIWGTTGVVKTDGAFQAGGTISAQGAQLNPWMQITQADYDALPAKNPNMLYVVVG
jgi:hypothetical protein